MGLGGGDFLGSGLHLVGQMPEWPTIAVIEVHLQHLADLALVDQGAKGMNAVVPFEELDRLLLRLAGYRTTPLALRSRRYLES